MKRKLLGVLLLLVVICAGCGHPSDQEARLRQMYLQTAKLCRECWQTAARVPSPYTAQEMWLTKAGQNELEACLRASDLLVAQAGQDGLSVLLAGSETVAKFYEQVQRAENASVTIYSVQQRGQLRARTYYVEDGEKLRTEAVISWDERGKPQVGSCYTLPVAWWTVTEKGNFICAYDQEEAAGYDVLRLQPQSPELAALAAAYITPIGYQGNDLFTSEWSESNWQPLALNDLFEYLYRLQMGEDFYGERYAFNGAKGRRIVPQALFEAAFDQYLAIPLETLREQAHYLVAEGGYPWVEQNCVTWDYQPVLVPDVVGYQHNDDGTLTLTVDVISAEDGTDRLFAHELTVRPLGGTSFQYVSNHIVNGEAVSYTPRLELAENYVSNIF